MRELHPEKGQGFFGVPVKAHRRLVQTNESVNVR